MQRFTLLAVVLALLCAGIAGFFFLHAPSQPTATDTPAPALSAPVRTAPAGTKEYHDTVYRFSVLYPDTLTQTAYYEKGGASTIVFQNPQQAAGFQIFIAPYKEDTISNAQFLKDEPSGVRDDVSNVTIDGVAAVSFYGDSAALGPTSEIWFIKGGYLYEVTALKSEAAWLSQIMATWKFF